MATNTCGCCKGTEKLTPLDTANRPGLPALAYRVGTHATFLETMKARLSTMAVEVPPEQDARQTDGDRELYPLRGLTTREASDPALALLDGWATVADVLAFYQERIANEGYLRTATERRSVLALARLIGYSLRPGVAATTYLAYTIESTQTTPVAIPIGARAQSMPGPGELPQSFETIEKLEARAAWNTLKPRLSRPQTADTIRDAKNDYLNPRLYLKGVNTNLKPNSPLLIDYGTGNLEFVRVKEVQPDAAADQTLVTLQSQQRAVQGLTAMLSPEAITAETKRQLNATVTTYLGEEANRIGLTRGVTFGRVRAHLESLQGQLADDVTFPAMLMHLKSETLPNLEKERQTAETNKYTDLEPWLQSMMDELGTTVEHASAMRAEALAGEFTLPATRTAGGGFGKQDTVESAVGSFSTADVLWNPLAGLVKPPSVPPRNALALDRRSSIAFASAADTNLQVVSAFSADVRESLSTVVANTKVAPDVSIKVYALRVKASVFGHNAPKEPQYEPRFTGYGDSQQENPKAGQLTPQAQWPEWTPADDEDSSTVFLDAGYDQILPGSYIVIQQPGQNQPTILRTISVATPSRSAYGLNVPTTKITLSESWWSPHLQYPYSDIFAIIRGTSVFAQSEELLLAEEPIDDPICDSDYASNPNAFIELDGVYSDLKAGRWLIVCGERTDIQAPDPDHPGKTVTVTGIQSSELVMLSEVVQRVSEADQEMGASGYYGYGPQPMPGERYHTYIRFAKPLAYCYKRDTVTIYGNVVKATHGETRYETLGSGDGSKALQTFALKQPPLTYVPSATPAGADSTLKVYVNDVEWHETDALAGLGPTDRRFITRTDDDGKTSVIFGNGRAGARVPTGIENVKSIYRNGIGKGGNVQAEQISLLATRPLGVKSVINPMRASGGADREARDQARRNAPLTVLALDRLVSVQDYADFARTFAGIGKSAATRVSVKRRELVHLTIAGADDIPIDPSSDLYRNLVKALRQFGDPDQPVQVDLRELKMLVISAKIRILPDYLWDKVVESVRVKLLDTFSFDRRELGQDLLLSEVICAIQVVAGVAYVDVDLLAGIDEKTLDSGAKTPRLCTPAEISEQVNKALSTSSARPVNRLPVNLAAAPGGLHRPAQLAFLSPTVQDTLILNQIG